MRRRQGDWFGPHELCLGVDVGKSSHRAVGLDRGGETRVGRRVGSRPDDVDAPPEEAGGAALAVVGQKDGVGPLVVRGCRARGADVGYLPGRSMRGAREMLPGTARSGRTDAEAIAQAGMSPRRAVPPVAGTDGLGASMPLPSPRLACATRRAAMARDGLHAALPEPDPAFGAAAGLPAAWALGVPAAFGGAAGIAAAGRRGHGAARARGGATRDAGGAFRNAACASAGPCSHPASEGLAVGGLADETATADAGRAEPSAGLGGMLPEDETHRCPPTVPGIGPETAAALVASTGIGPFPGGGRLAACCGLAPKDGDPGTSLGPVTSARAGDKALKSLLMFSCDSLVGAKSRFGRHYERCVARGMRHDKAPKAVARKRPRVTYAVMRGRVPYIEPSADGGVEKSSPAA